MMILIMNLKNNTLYNIIDITQNVLVYEFFRKIADLSTKSYIVLNMGFSSMIKVLFVCHGSLHT